ncbi:hypothetical protein C8Q80DRAFT_1313522 [Daedaleopsis nitida]|nr:hypothetical protein C8Q80DRAFT_1313522 [Daedaleopsis nitida]
MASSVSAQYTIVTAFALLLFEYLTTFDREAHYAWGRKLTWARTMFFLNRYLSLFQYFVGVGSAFLPPTFYRQVFDEAQNRVIQGCTAMLYVVWAVFSGLRLYAITEHARALAILVALIASLGPVIASIVSSLSLQVTVLALVINGSLLLSEGIVTVAVIVQTWNAHRKQRQSLSFSSLVLREEVLYFTAMLISKVFSSSARFSTNPSLAVAGVYLNLLPSILISRFYLNLYDLHEHDIDLRRTATLRWKALPPIPRAGPRDDKKGAAGKIEVHYAQEVFVYIEKLSTHQAEITC